MAHLKKNNYSNWAIRNTYLPTIMTCRPSTNKETHKKAPRWLIINIYIEGLTGSSHDGLS